MDEMELGLIVIVAVAGFGLGAGGTFHRTASANPDTDVVWHPEVFDGRAWALAYSDSIGLYAECNGSGTWGAEKVVRNCYWYNLANNSWNFTTTGWEDPPGSSAEWCGFCMIDPLHTYTTIQNPLGSYSSPAHAVARW